MGRLPLGLTIASYSASHCSFISCEGDEVGAPGKGEALGTGGIKQRLELDRDGEALTQALGRSLLGKREEDR